MHAGGRWPRIAETLAWIWVVATGSIALTVAVGWPGFASPLAVAQTLIPYLGVVAAAIAGIAFWRRRLSLANVSCATGALVLFIAAPLVFSESQPPAAPDAEGLRVASVNILYLNEHVDDLVPVLAALDADVIAFNEYTDRHAATLEASDLADRYPHRAGRFGWGPTGIALWSKVPLDVGDTLPTYADSIDAVVAGPDGPVRIVAMHVPTPLHDFDAWRRDLDIAADVGVGADGPTLLIGDLNTTFWHPDFRRLLDAGFVDAHIAADEGFSTSWPTTWIVPPFARLDHALTAGGLVSTDVDDFDVPGSDHRGVIVSVAPAR